MQTIKKIVYRIGRFVKYSYFRIKGGSYQDYYAARMDSIVRKNPDWGLNLDRKFQIDYLVSKGLKPEMRLLDYGCGAISAGRYFIEYLNRDNYTGVDISSGVLEEARSRVERFDLAEKRPRLQLVDEGFEEFVRGDQWDFVWAQSVFTHTPPDDIEKCVKLLKGSLDSGGVFFASFGESENGIEHKDFKDWYFPKSYFIQLGKKLGVKIEFMDDWVHPGDPVGRDRLVKFSS